MQSEMNQQFQDMYQRQFNCFTSCLTTLSSTVVSNKESSQKTESNLDNVTCTVSKFEYWLKKEENIYIDQQKDIKQYITEMERHVQSNAVMNTQFEETLNKAILSTEQVTTNLSEACNKATLSKCQLTSSRIDDIDKTLHDQEEEIQLFMDKISICSQQKEQFAGTHSTAPNYNDTTKFFPILKPTKHQSHQTQFLSNLEHIKISGDDILQLETTWNAIGTAFSNTF
eukprot:9964200-Ditylum_brightwellii.AAC.1